MLAAAMRFARLLHSTTYIPAWGKDYLSHGWMRVKVMQVAAILPFLVVVSQVCCDTIHVVMTSPSLS